MNVNVYLSTDIDLGDPHPHNVAIFTRNIPHDLGYMAIKAGIYKYLWFPEENDIKTAQQLIEPLEKGLERLLTEPAKFEKLLGNYEELCKLIGEYLDACREHPEATVSAWRE